MYNTKTDNQCKTKEVKNKGKICKEITKVDILCNGDIWIESGKLSEDLKLKKVKIYLNDKFTEEMIVSENERKCSIKKETLKIFGEKNKKYEIDSGYVDKRFSFKLIFKDISSEKIRT